MVRRIALAFLALTIAAGQAPAADVSTGYVQGPGGYYRRSDNSGPYTISSDGTPTLIGAAAGGGSGGSGGATGSVTAPGTSGTTAQAVQGITGGVPIPVTGSFSQIVTGSAELDQRNTTTLSASTANAAITLPLNGQSTVGFTFTGLTASGATLTYEQSNDNANTWTGVNEVNAGTGVPAATRSTDGQTRVAVQGRTNLRVRVSTPGTGTITVAYSISVREGLVTLASPLPPGSNNVGTFGLSGPIPAGTNSIGAVTQGGAPWAVSGTVAATQSGAWSVGLAAGTNAVGSVLADLRIGGAANAVGNPAFVQVTNFPGTQAVTGTVTANIGTLGGAASSALQGSVQAAPGSSSSSAQGVQGVTGGLPVGVSSTTLATAANQNVTAAGTTASSAQAVQGVAGGVPQNVASTGTFAVQNTAAVVGGNATAVKTDGSAVTQPVSAALLPLPTGAATATNQNVTQAGTSAGNAQAMQGVTGGVALNVAQTGSPWGVTVSNFPASQAVTNAGTFAVQNTAATVAGGNFIGKVGVDAQAVSGGLTNVSRIVASAASTNATVAKASPGRVYKITGLNAATSTRWLHLYNTSSAPTVGTTAVFFALPLPAGAFSFDAQDLGYFFGTGVAYSVTTGPGDADATAVAAGDILNLNVWYQ